MYRDSESIQDEYSAAVRPVVAHVGIFGQRLPQSTTIGAEHPEKFGRKLFKTKESEKIVL